MSGVRSLRGVNRTWAERAVRAAFDPKRKSAMNLMRITGNTAAFGVFPKSSIKTLFLQLQLSSRYPSHYAIGCPLDDATNLNKVVAFGALAELRQRAHRERRHIIAHRSGQSAPDVLRRFFERIVIKVRIALRRSGSDCD